MSWPDGVKCIHGISLHEHCPDCYKESYTQRIVPSKTQNSTADEHERAMQWYAWRDSGCAW